MKNNKILLIEDEEDISELITYNLQEAGFEVNGFAKGEEGLKAAREDDFSLILLDLMLPGIDGLKICSMLKSEIKTAKIPIIMVTAKGEEQDIIKGLEMGADDYITKPFSIKVLIARIKSVLRRKDAINNIDIIKVHDLIIHPGKHEIKINGIKVEFTPSEFKILHLLAQKPGWVFTRYQIVDSIRGENYAVTERLVDVLVVGIRKKLGAYENYIETIRGVGYRFKDE